MDVSLAALSSAVVICSQTILLVDVTSNLHPFYTHRMDAEGRILDDTDISWGHQVAVMFQIVSTLALEVPAFLQNIENLRGVSPDVHLPCEPWGHVNHRDGNCECLSSDRTGAYVHDLALMPRECLTVPELEDASVHAGGSGARMSHATGMGAGRPGSLPFVSHQPGAYGRLLLAVYVRWKTGLLVSSDWLRPVMRGGGGAGGRAFWPQCAVWLTSAD